VSTAEAPAVLEIRFQLQIKFFAVNDWHSLSRRIGFGEHLGKLRYIYYPETQYDGGGSFEWIHLKCEEEGSAAGKSRYSGLVIAPVPGARATYKRMGFASVLIDKDDPTIFSFPPIQNDASPSRRSAIGADVGGLSDPVRQHFASRYLSPEATESWEGILLIYSKSFSEPRLVLEGPLKFGIRGKKQKSGNAGVFRPLPVVVWWIPVIKKGCVLGKDSALRHRVVTVLDKPGA